MHHCTFTSMETGILTKRRRFGIQLMKFLESYISWSYVALTGQLDPKCKWWFESFMYAEWQSSRRMIQARPFSSSSPTKRRWVPTLSWKPLAVLQLLPTDDNYPRIWYGLCCKYEHVGNHIRNRSHGLRWYKFPDGVLCKHYIIKVCLTSPNCCVQWSMVDFIERGSHQIGSNCPTDGVAIST